MRWIVDLHNRTTLFTKVLVANGLIVALSLLIMGVLVHWHQGEAPQWAAEGVLLLAGLFSALAVNYAILRLAFSPLAALHHTLDRVRRGDYSARVPEVSGDPHIMSLKDTANQMLDRLDTHRQALASQLFVAIEDERRRIARELHDDSSQALATILVHLKTIELQVEGQSPEIAERLRLTKEITQRTLDMTRRLMLDLRPSALDDLGLVAATRWLVANRIQPRGVAVDLQVSGLDQRLSAGQELGIFRILQEAVDNVLRHARAKNLRIQLTRQPGRITFVVQDDGLGFHPVHFVGREESQRGFGIFSMKERAALMGGAVRIDTAPGRGTTVTVSVPDRLGGENADV